MLAHHHLMKTRDNMSAVIEGLQSEHGLLAAYLEATVNVEAHRVAAATELPEVVPSTSPFVFRTCQLGAIAKRVKVAAFPCRHADEGSRRRHGVTLKAVTRSRA